jgi:uncharacterized lipoprotein YmbA
MNLQAISLFMNQLTGVVTLHLPCHQSMTQGFLSQTPSRLDGAYVGRCIAACYWILS